MQSLKRLMIRNIVVQVSACWEQETATPNERSRDRASS